jgi:hypothetical protein
MSMLIGDVIWNRQGQPALVTEKDPKKGTVQINKNLNDIQNHSVHGIQNGLTERQRESYSKVVEDIDDSSSHAKEEISLLMEKISQLKENNADPRVLRYLENELQFMILENHCVPEKYEVNPINLIT